MLTSSGSALSSVVRWIALSFKPLAQFFVAAFQTWFPQLYHFYQSTMQTLKAKLPQLKFPVARSVFPGITVNFGGQVTCFRHQDLNNLAYGMCAITPLGHFDHTQSAQLVLEEPKVILELPHAATAFIMSAPCTHSNLPLAEGESRISVTQYAAGPIFRYVQNDCMTEEDLKRANPAKWLENQRLKPDAWMRGLELLPTVENIIDY